MESPIMPSENGKAKDSSKPSEHLVIKDCTTSNLLIMNKTKPKIKLKNEFVTVGSQPSIKKKISIVKSNPCKNSALAQKSSLILDQELISKEKDSAELYPFWSKKAKDLSQKLWLPTETDYVGSHSNSSNGCFNSMKSNSWFSIKAWNPIKPLETMNLSKISSPLSTFSIAESMVKEDTTKIKSRTNKMKKSKKPVADCCRRIRLFPNTETKKKLKSWFGCVRKTYNQALSAINEKKININLSDLRKEFTDNSKIKKDGSLNYMLETPKHVRDGCLSDLVEAFKSNFTKQKINPSFKFRIKYRSKREEQSILIESDSGACLDHNKCELKLYPRFLTDPIKYHIRQRDKKKILIPSIKYDCRLILDSRGKFYLNIPCHVSVCENQADVKNNDNSSWVSLDPGVRTFQTLYSPTPDVAYKIGQGDITRIYRLCLTVDQLISEQKKGFDFKSKRTGNRNKKSIKKMILKLKNRIKHLVDEVHWKAIHFLLGHFSNIVIPIFNVQNMINRQTRKITRTTVRQMLSWRHYTFRQRLISKVNGTSKRIYVVGEEYTTQTCGSCLCLNKHVGGNKKYNCPHCGVKLDRDLNGSRNIFQMNCVLFDESNSSKRSSIK